MGATGFRLTDYRNDKQKQSVTKEAISKTSRAVFPAKAGIQSFQGFLDCPIESGNDNLCGYTNGLLNKIVILGLDPGIQAVFNFNTKDTY